MGSHGERPRVLDAAQLIRIEAVHRGFLFQHLYAVQLLLSAAATDATSIVIEGDEDVEIVAPSHRTYVQLKFRSTSLGVADIADALVRFDAYRTMHAEGSRAGAAAFVVATNAPPTPSLSRVIEGAGWNADTFVDHPGASLPRGHAMTPPSRTIEEAFDACRSTAARLPFAVLSPETLVWKLAGQVAMAACGGGARRDHSFPVNELPALFEQLVIRLQELPSPPANYRAQSDEPTIAGEARCRLIVGHSGAGKTSWVAQAAQHAAGDVAYFDVGDIPGSALALSLSRELAARYGDSGGGLGRVLLPGASGLDILRGIGRGLAEAGSELTVVLDNAHRLSPLDLLAVVRAAPQVRFTVVGQPGSGMSELAVSLGVTEERLGGWTCDTIAAEAAASGCRADAATVQALLELTAGLPLYIQNAMLIAAEEHGGVLADFCASVSALTHVTETAQELILSRVVGLLPPDARDDLGVLSLSDVPLSDEEVRSLLERTFGRGAGAASANLRRMRTAGIIEVFGNRLKVHDAMRLLGRGHLADLDRDVALAARKALRDVVSASLRKDWAPAKLALYLRMLAETGDVKTLVQFGTEELFHELGLWPVIAPFLDAAARSEATDPADRFWALDGLVFNEIKGGSGPGTLTRIDTMKALVRRHGLGVRERQSVGMKEMLLLAVSGRTQDMRRVMRDTAAAMGANPIHRRIFRYNAAVAMYQAGDMATAADEARSVAEEYFRILGIGPQDVMGRNAPELRQHLKSSETLADDCKHLADCLELCAKAADAGGGSAPFARIHAMKFYELAQAPDSMLRVGMDVVDESVRRNDFTGAREFIESNLLPLLGQLKLASYLIPVRSQHAVVLAYCSEFDAADAEMARLAPYEPGLPDEGRMELAMQRRLVGRLRREGPPPQWVMPPGTPTTFEGLLRMARRSAPTRKVGRNAACPCGSGLKYKKCHG